MNKRELKKEAPPKVRFVSIRWGRFFSQLTAIVADKEGIDCSHLPGLSVGVCSISAATFL